MHQEVLLHEHRAFLSACQPHDTSGMPLAVMQPDCADSEITGNCWICFSSLIAMPMQPKEVLPFLTDKKQWPLLEMYIYVCTFLSKKWFFTHKTKKNHRNWIQKKDEVKQSWVLFSLLLTTQTHSPSSKTPKLTLLQVTRWRIGGHALASVSERFS